MQHSIKTAIIGGGAAGFFAAIQLKENFPHAEVHIFEKAAKVLSKVKITGGGRCNVTNAVATIPELLKAYPRGGKKLKKLFYQFNNQHMMKWLEDRGVELVVQEDLCVFPKAQDSQVIIDLFLKECSRLNIKIHLRHSLIGLKPNGNALQLLWKDSSQKPLLFDKVLVSTGGSPDGKALEWLQKLGHTIEPPVPSLFTFNMPQESIRKLMGVVVEKVQVSIQGTKLKSQGPLLITHWGMSGPAILILSSYGARLLAERNYVFNIQVNWVDEVNQESIKEELEHIITDHPQKKLANYRPYKIPERLWLFMLDKISLSPEKTWSELGKKGLNQLISVLSNDIYQVKGKTTFREEFVTCGGLSLQSVNMQTLESKLIPNLYFAGEVLDIDAITGGYNLQAAWTTAFVFAQLKK